MACRRKHRKIGIMTHDALRFGDFLLERAPIRLHHRGKIVSLPLKPLQLLVLLADRPGELVTHDDIRQALWPNRTVDYAQSVHVYIRQLRKALADDAETPTFITTEPRQGYRFLAAVERIETVSTLPQARIVLGKHARLAAACAVGLSVLTAGIFLLRPVSAPIEAPAPRFAGWDAYQRGVFLIESGQPATALPLLNEALARSPDEARIHAAVSRASMAAGRLGPAREHAQTALALDPALADGHEAMSHVLALGDWNWREARQHLETAIELDPDHVPALAGLAALDALDGEAALARQRMEQARSEDPASAILASDLALFHFYERRYRLAADVSRQAVELGAPRDFPDRIAIRAYLQIEDYTAARAAIVSMLQRGDGPDDLVQRFRDIPDRQLANAFYEWWLARERLDDNSLATQAILLAELGRDDEAVRAFSASVAAREIGAAFASLDPAFDSLRGDAVFRDAVSTMGLAANLRDR